MVISLPSLLIGLLPKRAITLSQSQFQYYFIPRYLSSASSCACPACGCCSSPCLGASICIGAAGAYCGGRTCASYPTPAMPARNARYNSVTNHAMTAAMNITNSVARMYFMLHQPSLLSACPLRSCSVAALPLGSPYICCQSVGIAHWCGGNSGRARAGVCGIASMRCILRVSFRHAFYLPDY
jgi:hypothetical protein